MEMTNLLLWAAIAAVLVLPIVVVVALVTAKAGEKKKAEAWARKALELGLEHAPESGHFHVRFPFELFERGESPGGHSYNLLTGELQARRVTLAQFRYTTRTQRYKVRHEETVCVGETSGLDLPGSVIHPGITPEPGLLGSIAGLIFPGELVRFDDPEFSSSYMVYTSDEARVREWLTPERRSLLVARRSELENAHIETSGNAILVSTSGWIGPDQARQPLDLSLSVMGLLKG